MHVSSELQEEGQILIVRSWKEIINLAANKELCAHIQSIQTVLPSKTITLVVYGTDQYFRSQKKRKNCEMRGRVLGVNELQNKPHHMSSVEEIPRVTRHLLEEVLAEVQLFTGCCVRLVESPPELGALVVYFTKAVAEMPFKILKYVKYILLAGAAMDLTANTPWSPFPSLSNVVQIPPLTLGCSSLGIMGT
uniref:(California timema) hypothetical protein n=1 Tax=Timema californicum TaxID=61474 RepID=A0A7R9PBJ3_TIMCA|nr:unnamed protein product [Timema californicum]